MKVIGLSAVQYLTDLLEEELVVCRCQ